MVDKVAVMNAARKKHRQKHYVIVRDWAKKFFYQYKSEPHFIAGIMLYWAEGKTTPRERCNLELNNANPKLLKIYCDFLRKYLPIKNMKLKARLFLYPDLNEKQSKLFWSNMLKIPVKRFIKSYISYSRSSVTKNKLPYGTCSVYIASTDLRMIMATWIELFANLHG